MPFVAYSDIDKFLPAGLKTALNKDKSFDFFENESAKIIHDITGIVIPSEVKDSPGWTVKPSAYIIIKLAMHLIEPLEDSYRTTINNDYNAVIKDLTNKQTRGIVTDTVYSKSDSIAVNQW